MKRAAIENYLVELTAAIAAAAALVLVVMPVQAQNISPRALDHEQAERLGLTLPSPKSQASGAETNRARDKLDADFQGARVAGAQQPFQAELYGLTLPKRVN